LEHGGPNGNPDQAVALWNKNSSADLPISLDTTQQPAGEGLVPTDVGEAGEVAPGGTVFR